MFYNIKPWSRRFELFVPIVNVPITLSLRAEIQFFFAFQRATIHQSWSVFFHYQLSPFRLPTLTWEHFSIFRKPPHPLHWLQVIRSPLTVSLPHLLIETTRSLFYLRNKYFSQNLWARARVILFQKINRCQKKNFQSKIKIYTCSLKIIISCRRLDIAKAQTDVTLRSKEACCVLQSN